MANCVSKEDRSLAPTPQGKPCLKAEKFKWANPSPPGLMMMIKKQDLNLDDEYQREDISKPAVIRIAKNWDWTLFGVIKVAKREDGSYWIFDGGHRWRASFYHQDITELPCIVFVMSDLAEEARAFVAGSKMRAVISAVDAFKASAVAKEPVSLATKELLDHLGITVKKDAVKAKQLKCISTVEKMVRYDVSLAKRVLEISLVIAGDHALGAVVPCALFQLVVHFKERGKDVLNSHRDDLLNLTQSEVKRAVQSHIAEVGKAGEKTAATALMHMLNKGKRGRNKLQW